MKRKVLVNYADEKFVNAQKYCTKMAYRKGGFDTVWEYSPKETDVWFNNQQKKIMEENPERFGKYGLWRPYVLRNALEKLGDGEFLFYLDSGAFFIKPVDLLIAEMEKDKQYIMCFDIPTLEKQWTKRDIFIYLDADDSQYTDTPQRMSGMILIKKCKESVFFIERYVDIATKMPELFTDSENILGKKNYFEYIENRHNQSVFSVLSKKYKLIAYCDPTEIKGYPKIYQKDERFCYTPTCNRKVNYEHVIISHRYPIITLGRKIKLIFRRFFPARIYFGISFFLAKFRT